MNQIIYNMNKKEHKLNKKLFFKILFSVCIMFLIFFTLSFFYKTYKSNQNDKISQKLITSYSISTLFSKNTTYEVETQNENTPFVIRYYKN